MRCCDWQMRGRPWNASRFMHAKHDQIGRRVLRTLQSCLCRIAAFDAVLRRAPYLSFTWHKSREAPLRRFEEVVRNYRRDPQLPDLPPRAADSVSLGYSCAKEIA